MKLRGAFVAGLSLALLLSITFSADADFNYVRSIPAPHNPEHPGRIAGLDRAGSLLLVVATYLDPDSLDGGSRLFEIAHTTGEVIRQQDFVGTPGLCASNYWQVGACAFWHDEVGDYWAADECGEIDEFTWPDSIRAYDSFQLPAVPRPISMVASSDTLFVLNYGGLHQIIARYHVGESTHMDTIPLEGFAGVPVAMTIWRDHFLVSSDLPRLWEYTKDGHLVAMHFMRGTVGCQPLNMTSLDDLLYVAGADSDSICIFEPAIYESEVPEGDSVVVEAVPEKVEVTFDSVSTEGWFTGETVGGDPCPRPEGVAFFGEFYHLGTTAHFDYAAQTVVSTPEGLPPGVDPAHVRVFARPSGECRPYLDVTVAPIELPTALMSLTRNKSEEDEFSVFTLGEDWRPPRAAIELKFEILAAAITAGQDSIPPDPRMRIWNLLNAARDEYYRGRSVSAAAYVDSIAITARQVRAIPHTFDPETTGRNLAGKLISDAHTLSFSLRFSESVAMITDAFLVPEYIDETPDGFIRSYQDVPPEMGTVEVDNQHIYIEHLARAIPESTSVESYATEGGKEVRRVRAVFHADEVAAVIPHVTEANVRLTCFICGYEVFSNPTIFGPGAGVPSAPRDVASGLVIKSNPSSSSFGFEVSSSGDKPVEIRIYSVPGQLVRALSLEHPQRGASVLTWLGDNQDGSRVSPGAYFVVARFDGRTITRKVVLER
jgi:hypothetical protein